MMEINLKTKIEQAPKAPGCYLFKDSKGIVIYVGKSKRLAGRVKQYFQKSSQTDERRQSLARNIQDVEYLVTATETEALIQEYRLIKAHKPWYNRQLKADRKHACLKITSRQVYPAICITHGQADQQQGDQVFGYFRSNDDAARALELLAKAFGTPACGKKVLSGKENPCLRYHLDQCTGPCGGRVDAAQYQAVIHEISSLLKGRRTAVLRQLKKQMKEASEALDFERAGDCRQLLEELDFLRKRSQRLVQLPLNRDVLVFLRAYGEPCFSLFYIAKGNVTVRVDFPDAANLDKGRLAHFLQERKQPTGCFAPWLSRCLTDIYAEKRFVTLPLSLNDQRLKAQISKEHQIFIGTKE